MSIPSYKQSKGRRNVGNVSRHSTAIRRNVSASHSFTPLYQNYFKDNELIKRAKTIYSIEELKNEFKIGMIVVTNKGDGIITGYEETGRVDTLTFGVPIKEACLRILLETQKEEKVLPSEIMAIILNTHDKPIKTQTDITDEYLNNTEKLQRVKQITTPNARTKGVNSIKVANNCIENSSYQKPNIKVTNEKRDPSRVIYSALVLSLAANIILIMVLLFKQ